MTSGMSYLCSRVGLRCGPWSRWPFGGLIHEHSGDYSRSSRRHPIPWSHRRLTETLRRPLPEPLRQANGGDPDERGYYQSPAVSMIRSVWVNKGVRRTIVAMQCPSGVTLASVSTYAVFRLRRCRTPSRLSAFVLPYRANRPCRHGKRPVCPNSRVRLTPAMQP